MQLSDRGATMRAIITQRESVNTHGGAADSLEHEYVDFFEAMGFVVFPISGFTTRLSEFFSAVNPDLVVLTGGGIIQSETYRYDVFGWHQDDRDHMEDKLIRAALDKNIPLLGICRGMYKLNAYFGGRISCLDDANAPRTIGHPHPVELMDGKVFEVNHFHGDALYDADLGNNIAPIAYDSENSSIEAFRHTVNKALGLQWHPERMQPEAEGRKWAMKQIALLFN